MFPPPAPHEHPDADASIRMTDTDASIARLSAVQKQYLRDPFIKHLVPRAHLQPPRPPLINIGTFVRSEAIDRLVDRWLALASESGAKKCQIVSLGAGSDTRFWRIATGPHSDVLESYFELDFPEVTSKKAMSIRKSKDLSAVLGSADQIAIGRGGTSLTSPRYNLLPVDLRLPPSSSLAPLLTSTTSTTSAHRTLSPDLPTLLLFECVLVYMTPEASSALIQWFADFFSQGKGVLGGIVYEMFGLNDPFGRVMLNNLISRNVALPGVDPYPSLASLPQRFLQHGFTAGHALTLREIRANYIDQQTSERVASLEMLDEVEELDLVLQHYAITWGVKLPGTSSEGESEGMAAWREWGLQKPVEPVLDEDDY